MENPQPQSPLSEAQKQASNCGLDISKLEALLQAIEQTLIKRSLSNKYRTMFYLAATGLYSAEDLAEMFGHSSRNLNSDFNHNIGNYLRLYFELDCDERVGITSLRRILFKKGYLFVNDILTTRYAQNQNVELESPLDTRSSQTPEN